MKNKFFKGLNKKLDEGCLISVSSYGNDVVTRVESDNELELYDYGENLLTSLNNVSNRIINEVEYYPDYSIVCKQTKIDNVLEWGYIVKFKKNDDGCVISSICDEHKYLTLEEVSSSSLEDGLNLLNEKLNVDVYKQVQIGNKTYKKKLNY